MHYTSLVSIAILAIASTTAEVTAPQSNLRLVNLVRRNAEGPYPAYNGPEDATNTQPAGSPSSSPAGSDALAGAAAPKDNFAGAPTGSYGYGDDDDCDDSDVLPAEESDCEEDIPVPAPTQDVVPSNTNISPIVDDDCSDEEDFESDCEEEDVLAEELEECEEVDDVDSDCEDDFEEETDCEDDDVLADEEDCSDEEDFADSDCEDDEALPAAAAAAAPAAGAAPGGYLPNYGGSPVGALQDTAPPAAKLESNTSNGVKLSFGTVSTLVATTLMVVANLV